MKNNKRAGKALRMLLALVLVLCMMPLSVFAAELTFTDVKKTDWFYNDVAYAVETGLVAGKGSTKTYCPYDNLTYGEAVKLAACMNQKFTTGSVTLKPSGSPWYQSFVDYAKTAGIITKDYEWTKPATRAGYMEIFAAALPDTALQAKNTVDDGTIPDVPMTHAQAASIYKMYRAGILTGSDAKHSCNPSSSISRAEVAAILTRMMDATKRLSFEMKADSAALKIVKDVTAYQMKSSNEDATFNIEISGGTAPYEYKWRLIYGEHEAAKEITDKSSKLTSSAKFNISDYDYDDYKQLSAVCFVTDAKGNTVQSTEVEIKQYAAATLSATLPETVAATEGVKIDGVITPAISNGSGSYTYEWYYKYNKDGWKKSADSDANYELGASVLKSGDKWDIYCVVTDTTSKQTATSNTCSFTVKAATFQIVVQPKDYQMKSSNEDATFEIEVSGGVAPYEYTWRVYYGENDDSTQKVDKSSKTKSTVSFNISDYDYDDYKTISAVCYVKDANGNKLTSDYVDILQYK